jgi:DNA-binding response OmpR family regulator
MARVLLVSDDSAIIEQVTAALKLDGHELVIVSAGVDVPAYLTSGSGGSFDLLLVDGTTTVYELLPKVRSVPALAPLPVIELAGKDAPLDRMEGAIRGPDMILWKPINPAELRAFVRRLLTTAHLPPKVYELR